MEMVSKSMSSPKEEVWMPQRIGSQTKPKAMVQQLRALAALPKDPH